MALIVLADTTALINLFLCGRMEVLQALTGGNAFWTSTLRRECLHRELVGTAPGELRLDGLVAAADAILGEPIAPEEDEHRPIRDLRQQMARPGEHPDQHLGEAEVIVVVQKRRWDAIFVTDDGGARRFAAGSPRCIDSWDLLKAAQRRGILLERDLWKARTDLKHHGRLGAKSAFIRPDAFREWLAQ